MSAIRFHTPSDGGKPLYVSGSERAHFGILCSRMLVMAVGPIFESEGRPHWLRKWLPPEHYLQRLGGYQFKQAVETALSVDLELVEPRLGQRRLSSFVLGLNTAMAMGNAHVQLLARIHGQCEIHGYVEGPNRAWLAGLIEAGRRANVYRENMGWGGVVQMLRARADEPVVMSYSVTEWFPGADPDDENREEPRGLTWDEASERLRRVPQLELKPDGFSEYRFEDGLSGFDLEARAG